MLSSPNPARITCIVGVVALLLSAVEVGADEIYKYQRKDGTWVFTDNPDQVPERVRGRLSSGKKKPTLVIRDWAQRLQAKLKPKTAIEEAMLAVVTVKSDLGKGSGFFISEDGYLLTNLHVLELPARERKRRERVKQKVTRRLDKAKRRVAHQQKRLNRQRQRLASYQRRMTKEKVQHLSQQLSVWQQEINQQRAKIRQGAQRWNAFEHKSSHLARVSSMAVNVDISLANSQVLTARRVAANSRWDLALLKVDGVRVPMLDVMPEKETPVGDTVYAIGNPIILKQSVAKGVLSGYEKGYVKTDAKIYPGNSGGPLVDEAGRVIGVNSFKKLTHRFEGLGFAVPVQRAFEIFSRHLKKKRK